MLLGNKLDTGVYGVLLAEKWKDKVFDVKCVSDRLMMIKIIVGEVITVLLVYTRQTGLTIAEKESLFYDTLHNLVQTIDGLETLLICGDFNGHI